MPKETIDAIAGFANLTRVNSSLAPAWLDWLHRFVPQLPRISLVSSEVRNNSVL